MKLFAANHMFQNATSSQSKERGSGLTSGATGLGKALLALGCASMGAAALIAALSLTAAPAIADFDGPPGSGDDGSDPTVGTLPTYGDSGFDLIDQTITLRGSFADVRAAYVDVSGAGAKEAIDLGDGQVWIRYYGDIQLELNLAALANVEVSIFSGFEGNGLTYAIGQANGFGDTRVIGAGGDIRIDPLRFNQAGLLGETLFVAGLHQTGARTMTSLDYRANDGVVVIRQDI